MVTCVQKVLEGIFICSSSSYRGRLQVCQKFQSWISVTHHIAILSVEFFPGREACPLTLLQRCSQSSLSSVPTPTPLPPGDSLWVPLGQNNLLLFGGAWPEALLLFSLLFS